MKLGKYIDFTRCQRADGTHYGTAGVCRKGRENPLDTYNRVVKLGDKKDSNPFTIRNKIGGGAFANVHDIGNGVVVKVGEIPQNEIKALEILKHVDQVPRIIANSRGNTKNSDSLLAMSKITGYPISRLKESDRNEAYDKLILPVLHKIHKAGVAHNDLHDGNMLLNVRDPHNKRLTIVDFGQATFNNTSDQAGDLWDIASRSSPERKRTIESAIAKHIPTDSKTNPTEQQIKGIWQDLGFS